LLSVDLNVIPPILDTLIALAMSGVSSTYVSESAERQHALGELEDAMISYLHDSAYAVRWTPLLIASVMDYCLCYFLC